MLYFLGKTAKKEETGPRIKRIIGAHANRGANTPNIAYSN